MASRATNGLGYTTMENAITSICPSRSSTPTLGRNINISHKLWHWYWNATDSTLHHVRSDEATEDVYIAGRKPNRFQYSHNQRRQNQVQPTIDGSQWRLLSTAELAPRPQEPSSFLEVLESWGNMWLWDELTVHGNVQWIEHATKEGTLLAVTDGSYIQELYPNLCSAAFVLECRNGQGRAYGSLLEALYVANAYQGELLGLMATHLILLGVNIIRPGLTGSVEVASDCLWSIDKDIKPPTVLHSFQVLPLSHTEYDISPLPRAIIHGRLHLCQGAPR